MASRLNPYIGFVDTAREAMTFYQSIFGGQLDMNTFGEFGAPEGWNPDGIMHAMLVTDMGFTLMASDAPPGMPHDSGSQITISLSGDDGEALRGYFDKLAEGGNITMPLEKQMWGDVYGQLTDKFGINWMANIAVEE